MKNAKPDFDTRIITPIFRLSYPSIWKPKRNVLANRDQYSIVMLFDKKTAAIDLKAMKELAAKVATARFGAGVKGIKTPFKDGDTVVDASGTLRKESNPSIEGMIFVDSWSKIAPGVVNNQNEKIIDPDEVYGGCYCRAQLNCYAYDTAGQRGVNFGLLHVQKVKDGTPFGNRTSPEDAFSPVADDEGSFAEQTNENNPFA